MDVVENGDGAKRCLVVVRCVDWLDNRYQEKKQVGHVYLLELNLWSVSLILI